MSLHLKRNFKTIKANCDQEQDHCNTSNWQHRAFVGIEAILIVGDISAKHISGRIQLSQALNKTNDLILNLTPENVTQHSRIE